MTTYVPEVHARRPNVNLWLVAVLALAAGFVALGSWTLVDRLGGSHSGGAEVIDDLNAAVNAGDANALRTLFARDAVFVAPNGQQASGLDDVVSAVLIPHGAGLHVERAGPVASEGDFVAAFIRYEGGVEFGVWQFDDDGKIVRMSVYAP